MWFLERDIHIIAQHILGVQNVTGDAESRIMFDWSDWQLNPVIFSQIYIFSPIEVDMFASCLAVQCQAYFSLQSDPYAVATDA